MARKAAILAINNKLLFLFLKVAKLLEYDAAIRK